MNLERNVNNEGRIDCVTAGTLTRVSRNVNRKDVCIHNGWGCLNRVCERSSYMFSEM
jgi:hypothetical protein